MFARRLQVQERLTNQIANTIQDAHQAARRRRRRRGDAPVHVDARRREAELVRRHQLDDRRVSRQLADADGIPRADLLLRARRGLVARVERVGQPRMHRRIAAAVVAVMIAAPVAAQTPRRPPARKPAAAPLSPKEAPEIICPTPLGTGVTHQARVLRRHERARAMSRPASSSNFPSIGAP